MTDLTRYEIVCRELALMIRMDEVKPIHDKAIAMQTYARQAKDRELLEHSTEIRMRAAIRGGQILKDMADKGERYRAASACPWRAMSSGKHRAPGRSSELSSGPLAASARLDRTPQTRQGRSWRT